jgi:hypothetical protein
LIKKLRRQFIGGSLISIFVVLSAILFIGNMILYNSVNGRSDNKLKMILNNGGTFPQKGMKMKYHSTHIQNDHLSETITQAHVYEDDEVFKKEKDDNILDIRFEIDDPARLDTMYFSVLFDSKGNIVNTNSISPFLQEYATSLASDIYKGNTDKGVVDGYKYKVGSYGDGKIIAFVDCARDISAINLLRNISLSILVISMIATFIIASLFSKVALRPVEESYNKQKRFITDASHEIKTPLAVIDANTDILEMENGESEWTKSTKNQITRLTNLTNSLVSLARMDEGSLALEMEEFSLSELILEEYETYMPLAVMKNKKMEKQLEKNVKFVGNEQYIRQMIGIFLDNAIKYSTDDSVIEISLSAKRKIIIRNKAVGLKKDKNYDELFERFYRMDSSRNSSTGGYGIGLSLAKSIILMHKGKVSARSVGDDIMEFEIRL